MRALARFTTFALLLSASLRADADTWKTRFAVSLTSDGAFDATIVRYCSIQRRDGDLVVTLYRRAAHGQGYEPESAKKVPPTITPLDLGRTILTLTAPKR